jgi:hypothetical protein
MYFDIVGRDIRRASVSPSIIFLSLVALLGVERLDRVLVLGVQSRQVERRQDFINRRGGRGVGWRRVDRIGCGCCRSALRSGPGLLLPPPLFLLSSSSSSGRPG